MTDEAETPLSDHIARALERMKLGARMILDSIPNDSSLSSSAFSADTVKAIAALARIGMAVQPRPIEEAPKDGRPVLLIGYGPGSWAASGQWVKYASEWRDSASCSHRLADPTHFIPLSALPAPQSSETGRGD